MGDGRVRSSWQLGAPTPLLNGNLGITSEDGSLVFVFDSAGHHLQTQSALTGALITQFGYDSQSRLVSITDGGGNVTQVQRNAAGRATAILSPYGQATKLTLDGKGILVGVTDPAGQTVHMTNDGAGLITSWTDANGNISHYFYDTLGQLITDNDAAGASTTLHPTDSGNGYAVGLQTSLGRTYNYGVTRGFDHGPSATLGQTHTNIWPAGLQATESRIQQGSGFADEVSRPDAVSFSQTMVPDPIWGIQAPLASSSTYTIGNLSRTVSNLRTAILANAKDPFSVTSITDATVINGRTYTSVYSAATRSIVTTSQTGRTRTTVFDALDRVNSIQIGDLAPWTFSYDSHGNLVRLSQGDRSQVLAYDANGFLTSRTDRLGRRDIFTHDADGRVLSRTFPDGTTAHFSYDPNGNITSVTPPTRGGSSFAYSSVNLLTAYNPLGSSATRFSYNLDRQLTAVTRPDGTTVSLTYDSAGRLTGVTGASLSHSFSYDPSSGNVASESTNDGETTTFAYKGPLPIAQTVSGVVSGTVSNTLDNDFMSTVQRVNGDTVNYVRDPDGYVTQAGVLAIARSPTNGMITGTMLGEVSDSRSYDAHGDLTAYAASSGSTVLYSVRLKRDVSGRIVAKSESIGGTMSNEAYGYDPVGRLTGVWRNGAQISSYSYDAHGNRTAASVGGVPVAANYSDQDALLSYGGSSYTSTLIGERATRSDATGTTNYRFDILAHLSSVTRPDGTEVSYKYDPEGRVYARYLDSSLEAGYLYDGDRLVAILDRSGAVVERFVYGTSRIVPDYMLRGGATYRIISDFRGSPRLVVDTSSGQLLQRIDYDEFGIVVNDSNPGFQPFGFGGGVFDQTTRLVRLGARYYDPQVGRWLSRDPNLFSGGDLNLYAYASSDPLNWIDPTGTQPSGVVGGSAYLGVGGGVTVSWGSEGVSVNVEIGAGSPGASFVYAEHGEPYLGNPHTGETSKLTLFLEGGLAANFFGLTLGELKGLATLVLTDPCDKGKISGKGCVLGNCWGPEGVRNELSGEPLEGGANDQHMEKSPGVKAGISIDVNIVNWTH
jgi:RHS repeat-associated protein